MMFVRLAAIVVLAALPALPAHAAVPPPSPAALDAGLAGKWQGALGYRDYQSNRLEEIPVATEIRALPDGVTVVRISAFNDGPKAGTVYITSVGLHDAATSQVTSATFRKGRAVETETETLAVDAFADATHWTLRSEAEASDDNKPARLRVTTVRDGDTLVATKDVRPLDGGGEWQFRNRTRLKRIAAP